MKLAKKIQEAAESEERQPLTVARDLVFEKRREFVEHYRGACAALGEYFAALDEATRLTNARATYFGVPPEDANALRALVLTASTRELLADMEPVTGNGWNRSFPVAPYLRKKYGG